MASASRRYRPEVKKDPATPEMSKSQVESRRITDKSLTLPDLRLIALIAVLITRGFSILVSNAI